MFRFFYECYYEFIYIYIFCWIMDEMLMVDFCLQVFFKVMQKIYCYEYQGVFFLVWLYWIVSNEIVQYFCKVNKIRVVIIEDVFLLYLFEEIGREILEDFILLFVQVLDLLKEEDF